MIIPEWACADCGAKFHPEDVARHLAKPAPGPDTMRAHVCGHCGTVLIEKGRELRKATAGERFSLELNCPGLVDSLIQKVRANAARREP